MEAITRDHKLFRKLIHHHQAISAQSKAIMVNDVLITEPNQVAAEGGNYNEELATLK